MIDGVFGHDVFKDCYTAFNIYRINAISQESGVSNATHCQWKSAPIPVAVADGMPVSTVLLTNPWGGVTEIPVSGWF